MTPRHWLTWTLATIVVWVTLQPLPFAARAMATVLIGPLPAFTFYQKQLVERIGFAALPRTGIYFSSAITLWALAFFALWAAAASRFTPAMIGLAPVPWKVGAAWVVFVLAAALLLVALGKLLRVRESPLLYHLLPVTWLERAAFVLVSLTAGITEEIIYRGFLIVALGFVTQNLWIAALGSAVAFGLVHAYQSLAGLTRATLLGFALAIPYLLTGSLLPSMLAHLAIDLIAGLWLVEQLREQK